MGWLFKPGSNRKGLIQERKTGWERQQPDGTIIKSTCLAACYRGNPFSGVLWSVWERTFEKDGQQVEPTQRWITCDLLRYDRCDEGWGYKDMEESMHPYYILVPVGLPGDGAHRSVRRSCRVAGHASSTPQPAQREAAAKAFGEDSMMVMTPAPFGAGVLLYRIEFGCISAGSHQTFLPSGDIRMPAFLKIENIGVCPPEGFTVLGVSLADTSNQQGVIGQFGSGNKHGVAVCLRNDVAPVVFCGTLKLEFFTKPQTVSDSQATEDLGFVLDYGKQDWDEVALALREFVSNSIDRSIREHGDWNSVKIEIVDETRVRAKSGSTRVFIPLTPKVIQFYSDLGKWFLHFSEAESLDKAILPKANRNLGDRKAAVIYP